MDFNTFEPLCPHGRTVYPYRDDHTKLAVACQREDRIPPGHSWGICDEAHCPYFGIEINGANVTVHDGKGAVVGRSDSIKLTAVKTPEDWE